LISLSRPARDHVSESRDHSGSSAPRCISRTNHQLLSRTPWRGCECRVFQVREAHWAQEILARSLLFAGDIHPPKRRPTLDQLLGTADERNTRPLVDICRRVREAWSEECQKTFGGSFRYWNSGRMVFGVNVANNWGHSPGQLDVWIRMKGLAETTGVAETEIREMLTTQYQPFDIGGNGLLDRLEERQ